MRWRAHDAAAATAEQARAEADAAKAAALAAQTEFKGTQAILRNVLKHLMQ